MSRATIESLVVMVFTAVVGEDYRFTSMLLKNVCRFRARLEPVPHGGCFVVVPPETADVAGARLAPSRRREYTGSILEAKTPETRQRRIARVLAELQKAR